jgi:hypothetical protein
MLSDIAQMVVTKLSEHKSWHLHVHSISWPEAAEDVLSDVAHEIIESRINKDLSLGEWRA